MAASVAAAQPRIGLVRERSIRGDGNGRKAAGATDPSSASHAMRHAWRPVTSLHTLQTRDRAARSLIDPSPRVNRNNSGDQTNPNRNPNRTNRNQEKSNSTKQKPEKTRKNPIQNAFP